MIISYLLGTAFLVKGHLITAGHIVDVKNTYDVSVIEIDEELNGINSSDELTPKCRKIKSGETLTIKGYPEIDGTRNYTEVKGKFLDYNTSMVGDVATQSLMIQATIYGGISGGPVVDSK